MPILRLFYAHAILHWGFIVRFPGVTAAQPALAIAPPTTITGAFASSLLNSLGFSDGALMTLGRPEKPGPLSRVFECILESTVAATMGLYPRREGPGIGVIMEPSRLVAAPYKTSREREKFKHKPLSAKFYSEAIPSALPVQAVGTAYAPSAVIDLLWVVDIEKLVRCLPTDIKTSDIDTVGLKAAYGVTRLGSKEGICSVLAACYVEDPQVEEAEKIFRAYTYVPTQCVDVLQSNLAAKVQLWDLSYKLTDYYAPLGVTSTIAYPPDENKYVLPVYKLTNRKCTAYYINVSRLPETCEALRELNFIEKAVAVGPMRDLI